jgi:hypothetical protein
MKISAITGGLVRLREEPCSTTGKSEGRSTLNALPAEKLALLADFGSGHRHAGGAHFTGFAAIRTVVQTVHAQPDALLPRANAAVPGALAFGLGAIANRTYDWRHPQNIENRSPRRNAIARPARPNSKPSPEPRSRPRRLP